MENFIAIIGKNSCAEDSLKSLSKVKCTELCIFSDAFFKAIGAVAYLKSIHENGQINVGFVFGKDKLTSPDEPTIPRLEPFTAVLAVEISDLILDEIGFKTDSVIFFCYSKVVLSYIHNECRRICVYVHNCVQRLINSSKAEQWHFVPSTIQLSSYKHYVPDRTSLSLWTFKT